MADYNTFVVCDTKGRNILLVTSSARKSAALLKQGIRIEVWNNNRKTDKIFEGSRKKLDKYIEAEKEHIRNRQKAATERSKKRWKRNGKHKEPAPRRV